MSLANHDCMGCVCACTQELSVGDVSVFGFDGVCENVCVRMRDSVSSLQGLLHGEIIKLFSLDR